MSAQNRLRASAAKVSMVSASGVDEAAEGTSSPVYCMHCDSFVEPKIAPSSSSRVIYVSVGVAALLLLPALENTSIRSIILFSGFFGAALAIYVASRRPTRNRVCGQCSSPYIYFIEQDESLPPRT